MSSLAGGRSTSFKNPRIHKFRPGDIISCFLDLGKARMMFKLNNSSCTIEISDIPTAGMFFPIVTMSARVICRFLLGENHGKQYYLPADEDFLPLAEVMLPDQRMRIEQCFAFGDLKRRILCGENEIPLCACYCPKLIDISQITLQPSLHSLQTRLAENAHDEWCMKKISEGYRFSVVDDKSEFEYSLITSFENLPEEVKANKLDKAMANLKTILALKLLIQRDAKYDERRVKFIKLHANFTQSNGYKPQPLDISVVSISNKFDNLIDSLAENAHNNWVADRVSQGWTYSTKEDEYNKRSPYLLPFDSVNENIRDLNRRAAQDLVRSIYALGYYLEHKADTDDLSKSQQGQYFNMSVRRYYRVDRQFGVHSGKWYFEVEIMTSGYAGVGWGKANSGPLVRNIDGSYEESNVYIYSGHEESSKCHITCEQFGKKWKRGDIVGLMIDLHDRTISFSLNGELLHDNVGSDAAFELIDTDDDYVPIIALAAKQKIRFNFGNDVHSLKYFTVCGLQEGYEPFCVNMCRPVTFWYTNRIPQFSNATHDNSIIDVVKTSASRNCPPLLKIAVKSIANQDQNDFIVIRLNLPLKCADVFQPRSSLLADKEKAIADSKPQNQAYRSSNEYELVKDRQNIETPSILRKNLSSSARLNTTSKRSESKKRTIFSLISKEKPSAKPSLVMTHTNNDNSQKQQLSKDKTRIVNRRMTGEEDLIERSCLSMDILKNIINTISDYCFSLRIFPGQDLSQIFVGWAHSSFSPCQYFDISEMKCTNTATCIDTDPNNNSKQKSTSLQHCYIASVSDIIDQCDVLGNRNSGVKIGNGTLVCCVLDIKSGCIRFFVDDFECSISYTATVSSMLYPVVITSLSKKEIFQFELGRYNDFLPLSSGCFQSLRMNPEPRCPPRMHVQVLQRNHWARLPNDLVKGHYLKLSNIRGWSVMCDDPVYLNMAYYVEDNYCVDLLSLSENKDDLIFCTKQIKLFTAICSQNNCRTAFQLFQFVDENQLLYCLENEYMPGMLRRAFYDLLFAMFLQPDFSARQSICKEYIIPLNDKLMQNRLLHMDSIPAYISPSIDCFSTVQIGLLSEEQLPGIYQKILVPPKFDINKLKKHAIASMQSISIADITKIRDPIGGSFSDHFVPILQLIDKLLTIGIFSDSKIKLVVKMLDSTHMLNYLDPNYSQPSYPGLLHEKLDEPILIRINVLIDKIFDFHIQRIVQNIVSFSNDFVTTIQTDQKQRYTRLKESNLSPATMAKRTREFRSPAKDQMQVLVQNKPMYGLTEYEIGLNQDIQIVLRLFHDNVMHLLKSEKSEQIVEAQSASDIEDDSSSMENFFVWIFTLTKSKKQEKILSDDFASFFSTVTSTLIKWTSQSLIKDNRLIRTIFSILFRQYKNIEQLDKALENTYVVRNESTLDIKRMLRDVSVLRCIREVQMGTSEESLVIECLCNIMDNRIFFQHPDLIRMLSIHETVLEIMVDRLNRQKQEQDQINSEKLDDNITYSPTIASCESVDKVALIITCCKLLSYYCRTSAMNQRAMFEHLGFLLDNSLMLLSRPSLRGQCPLDVACASLMDNNELALALRENHLERIALYLSRCGTTRNEELCSKGYQDIGWDPVEGERFLDFLKFCVWVNGDTVEENADLVIRLLIRRPDCLGPALRGEGGGLLQAINEGIELSVMNYVMQNMDDNMIYDNYEQFVQYECWNVESRQGSGPSPLIQLLGTCSPSEEAVRMGKPSALKARSILKSLVSIEDLKGVLAARFCVIISETEMPPGILPEQKMCVMFFLERVYGISDQACLFKLLDGAFLPDIRYAILLDIRNKGDSNFALALNRYICNSVMTILTKYSNYFNNTEKYSNVIDQTLQMVYRFARCKALTKIQRDQLMEFLVVLTSYLNPSFMNSLFNIIIEDIHTMSDSVIVTLKILSRWYHRLRLYYGSNSASENEKLITIMLFQVLFDTLSARRYDPELFSEALPCMTAIACSLPPDCTLTINKSKDKLEVDRYFDDFQLIKYPTPLSMSTNISKLVPKISSINHDNWSYKMVENGWQTGEFNSKRKYHPNIRPHNEIPQSLQDKHNTVIVNALSLLRFLGYELDKVDSGMSRKPQKATVNKPASACCLDVKSYIPKFVDIRQINSTREMAKVSYQLSRLAHEKWLSQLLAADSVTFVHSRMVAYDLLTPSERQNSELFYVQMLQILAHLGYRLVETGQKSEDVMSQMMSSKKMDQLAMLTDYNNINTDYRSENRFAFTFLSKLISYVDKAANNMEIYKDSVAFSKLEKFFYKSEDIKFFTKVILPLLEQYFHAHRAYFINKPSIGRVTYASVKEKEMVCTLFCKLAALLRNRFDAFGTDISMCTRCLQVLVRSIDVSSVMKNSAEIVRASLGPFFNACADDLIQTVNNIKNETYSYLNGTLTRGGCSLLYLHLVSLPVLSAMLDHIGKNDYGKDIFVNDIAIAGFKILNAAWIISTQSEQLVRRNWIKEELERHRPLVGECLSSLASCFPVAFLEQEFFATNEVSSDLPLLSPESNEVMQQINLNIPSLTSILQEIQIFALNGGQYAHSPHIFDVILPVLSSYIAYWHSLSSTNSSRQCNMITAVKSEDADTVLIAVLRLIGYNMDSDLSTWMKRIALNTIPIITLSGTKLLEIFCFVTELVKVKADRTIKEELSLKYLRLNDPTRREEMETEVFAAFDDLIRVVYALFPILMKYADLHKSTWLKDDDENAELLYNYLADIFNLWATSKIFKRQELNYVSQNAIDSTTMLVQKLINQLVPVSKGTKYNPKLRKLKKKTSREKFSSLIVACIKRVLPVGLKMYSGVEQELIQLAKDKMVQLKIIESENQEVGLEDTFVLSLKSDHEEQVINFLKSTIQQQLRNDNYDNLTWQSMLYRKIKTKRGSPDLSNVDIVISRIMSMAKVLYGLHLVDHPPQGKKGVWRKLITTQRKKAVVACFRVAPLHSIPRHRAINLFISAYRQFWLHPNNDSSMSSSALIKRLTSDNSDIEVISTIREEGKSPDCNTNEILTYNPLRQFIQCLNRAATTENQTVFLELDSLYLNFALLMSESIYIEDEGDDDDKVLVTELKSIEEQELEKQTLLAQQNRLANRSVAETVTHYISACNGENNDMLKRTLQLGISLLHGGNKQVQKGMLKHLKATKDIGFFSSIATLIGNCSVLDLDIFERTLKAESLGSSQKGAISDGNLSDADFICDLFRFLQLLCEGHFSDFQNYLRAQVDNSTTVNLVICSVDYLLCLQESMMDFYWHFSGKDTMDATGKECFCRSIDVSRQVLKTLTEYIQGPCVQNQLALANSRLWDAVSGFIFMFANLQNKLSKDPRQIELMRELMKLQKDMIIMLLSMLEGNVLQGPIGKQMVDTLIEAQPHVEMLLQFFDIFLKMKGLTTSEAFLEFDTNKDGFISPKEFKRAMKNQKMYSDEEIDYILMCVDANQDGKIDFIEFTERFHNPARDIGFNMAILLTNLAEHVPHDMRLFNLMEKEKGFLSYFDNSLGRIEIMGSSNRIERVYFEINESNREQWNKPQIKDSKKQFLNSIVNETDDKEKQEAFVNFCEDTIFEMQHAVEIGGDNTEGTSSIASVRSTTNNVVSKTSYLYFLKQCIRTGILLFRVRTVTLVFMYIRNLTWQRFVASCVSCCKSGINVLYANSIYTTKLMFYFIWQLLLEDSDTSEDDTTSIATRTTKLKNEADRRNTIFQNRASYIPEDPTVSTFSAFGLEIRSNTEECDPNRYMCNLNSSSLPSGNNERNITSLLDKIKTKSSSLKYDMETQDSIPLSSDLHTNNTIGGSKRFTVTHGAVKSFLALNFYKLKYLALILAFIINFFVLYYKVIPGISSGKHFGSDDGEQTEYIAIDPDRKNFKLVLALLAIIHSCVSFSMLVAYYVLKVPLVIFRREKEISRKLEFDGMWIVEQPSENDLKSNWDKLVLSTNSFPSNFWNKFVKKKVRSKYADQYDIEDLNKLLGLDQAEYVGIFSFVFFRRISSIDWKYNVWKWGAILTDKSFIYLLLYFAFSVMGNFNHFFFASHLIDIAVSIKALSTIIVSITQNGRQLLLTITLMTVVVYIYSVIAFNFFRKFYKSEDSGDSQNICSNMLSCFVFHIYHGVRAGGGIGDELESPYGDSLEFYRIAFDMTFFFFVVIILLAILQGLIIDAFSELREQLDSVKETLESKCFICGIGQDYFNKEPHGFEIHTSREHDFADYMFFLMHLINKPDTEHTGQESYVWDQYQNRKWDFFPVGDCFRKHYDNVIEPV
ncbi:hypothetical protein GJ496_001976 [Pomphorhynchus laevis]|nr:hypothetical protein GJ496_001976 [Pomphorhynchus laevis]